MSETTTPENKIKGSLMPNFLAFAAWLGDQRAQSVSNMPAYQESDGIDGWIRAFAEFPAYLLIQSIYVLVTVALHEFNRQIDANNIDIEVEWLNLIEESSLQCKALLSCTSAAEIIPKRKEIMHLNSKLHKLGQEMLNTKTAISHLIWASAWGSRAATMYLYGNGKIDEQDQVMNHSIPVFLHSINKFFQLLLTENREPDTILGRMYRTLARDLRGLAKEAALELSIRTLAPELREKEQKRRQQLKELCELVTESHPPELQDIAQKIKAVDTEQLMAPQQHELFREIWRLPNQQGQVFLIDNEADAWSEEQLSEIGKAFCQIPLDQRWDSLFEFIILARRHHTLNLEHIFSIFENSIAEIDDEEVPRIFEQFMNEPTLDEDTELKTFLRIIATEMRNMLEEIPSEVRKTINEIPKMFQESRERLMKMPDLKFYREELTPLLEEFVLSTWSLPEKLQPGSKVHELINQFWSQLMRTPQDLEDLDAFLADFYGKPGEEIISYFEKLIQEWLESNPRQTENNRDPDLRARDYKNLMIVEEVLERRELWKIRNS